MAGEEPSSVSVSFTADAAELQSTLDDIATKADEVAEDVEESFAAVTPEIDDKVVNQQLDDLITKTDDLGRKHPEIKPGVEDEDAKSKLDDLTTKTDDLGKKRPEIKPGVEDEDAKTKLDDLTTKTDDLGKKRPDIKPEVNDGDFEDVKVKLNDLDTRADDLGKKRPDIKPEVNDGDFEDVKVKLSDLDTKAAELDAEPVEIRTDVDDEDYADTVAKLEALKALADDIGAKNVVYNVKLSGSSVAEGASESDVKAAAQDLAGDLGNIVLKSMATVAIGAVVMPAAEVVASGLIYAIGGALTTAFSGANFALALTGSKNPVTIKFKKEVETILTSFDQAMAPYTAPALHSLLAPLQAYLTDVAPDVKGFGEGLEAIAKVFTTSLDSPAVKKVFTELGSATAKEMAQFGPVLANSLQGLGQLLVAAEPLILAFGKIATAMTKEFASSKAGKDESAWFQKLAKDLNQYAPIIHSIFDQIGTDLSQFATDIKPLEGPALKAVNNGLKVLGDVLVLLGPVISGVSGILGELEKLPGGGQAVGAATLGLAFKSTREFMGDLGKLGVALGKKLPGVSELDDLVKKMAGHIPGVAQLEKLWGEVTGTSKNSAAATMQTAADTMLEAAKKMNTAGDKEETAGSEEEAAGDKEDLGVGGAGAGVSAADLAGGAGIAGIASIAATAAVIALPAVIVALSATTKATPANVTRGTPGQMYGTTSQQTAYEEALTMASNENVGSGKNEKEFNSLLGQLNNQELTNVENVKKQYQSGYHEAAQDAAKGFIAGMLQYEGETAKQSAASATSIIQAFKNELGIKSPSTVFANLAELSLEGYANEIENTSIIDAAITKATNNILVQFRAIDSQLFAVGEGYMTEIASGMTANSGVISSAVNGALGGSSGRAGVSGTVTLAPTIQINIQSPNGTLAPQILAQVEQVAQQAAEEVVGTLQTGLFGL